MSRFIARSRRRVVLSTAAASLVVASVVAGCVGTRGVGETVNEPRSVGAFERIEAASGIDVEVHIGASRPIEIRAQSNILPLVSTTVENQVLRIRANRELDPLVAVTVVITAPAFDGIALGGGSDGTVTGFAGDGLDVTMTGGSDLTVEGSAGRVSIEASGGSEAHLSDLQVGTLDVSLSGGASVVARVTDEVRGSASAGAHVTVIGQARMNVQATGGAEVGRG